MTTLSNKKIIAIGGLPRSGKDAIAELFIAKGYFGVSLGDIVRRESRLRHSEQPDPISLANTTETSNYLRGLHGPDFALKMALEEFEYSSSDHDYKGLVVWSIRMGVEADFVLENDGILIWVEATDDVRYTRYIRHLREGEKEISKEDLLKAEALQWKPQPGIDESIQMNTSYVKSKANKVFENNSDDIAEFKKSAEQFISEL